ncbi:Nucleoid occlusion protein [Rhodococcus sp. T7]|nr:hypothetical protein [Rhodococcus sp. T7]KAF0957419.1 Nucleoid occlusion protein [Rhodococcus sp. T7]KAF0962110.1 Nucleoid occlusion protein [Rhodococcus sp. T7]
MVTDPPAKIGLARWVVINGCRRLAAAENFGRPNLDIIVKDEVAKDRETLLAAAVIENVGRRDFDVIEEAKAVELLIGECGTVEKAAMKLAKSKGWISQRRALLQLTPELQTALRNGELAVRTARSLAQVPPEAHVQAWVAEQQREHTKPDPDPAPESETNCRQDLPLPQRRSSVPSAAWRLTRLRSLTPWSTTSTPTDCEHSSRHSPIDTDSGDLPVPKSSAGSVRSCGLTLPTTTAPFRRLPYVLPTQESEQWLTVAVIRIMGCYRVRPTRQNGLSAILRSPGSVLAMDIPVHRITALHDEPTAGHSPRTVRFRCAVEKSGIARRIANDVGRLGNLAASCKLPRTAVSPGDTGSSRGYVIVAPPVLVVCLANKYGLIR